MPALTKSEIIDRGRDTIRALMREACLKSLWFLLTEVLSHPSIECDEGDCCKLKRGFYEPLHKPWCDWAQDDSMERKGLLAPRGHFKSTVVSFAKAIHIIIKNPNSRILLVSALDQNAKNFCGLAKTPFQHNPRFAWLFPEHAVSPTKQFGPDISFTTPARTNMSLAAPTFTSAYLDAALASQHYDHVLIDDPIEAKHVATEEQAQKARASFNKISPLLDPSTEDCKRTMIIVGTRWAYFDLYAGMVPIEQGGTATSTRFNWIVRSCLEKDGKPDFENGDPIFPTRFSRSVLMNLLEDARNDPAFGEQFWWNQYMNLCRPPDSAPFFEDWFVEVASDTLPPLFSKMIVVDTALKDDTVNKKGAKGDYTCILVGGWDREGRLYIVDGMRSSSMTSKIFLDFLVTYAQKYQIVTVVKQKVSEDTLGTQIRDAFAAVRAPLDYRPLVVQGLGRKVQRIKDALQAPMQKHEIQWVKRLMPNGLWEHHKLLEQAKKELLNLGQYPVDDVADTMANFYHPDIKFRKQNLVGAGPNNWRVPGAPQLQLGNNQGQLWMQRRRGAGWDNG